MRSRLFLVVILVFVLTGLGHVFAADDPPDVTLTIRAKIDSWGGSEYGIQYLVSCSEEGGSGCIITDEKTIYIPKMGPVVFVRWCNTWGQCSWTAYWPEP